MKSIIKRYVFWQESCSPHQRDLVQALLDCEVEVVWCVDNVVDKVRESQGWSFSAPPGVRLVVAPDESTVLREIEDSMETSLHICSFSRSCKCSLKALRAGLKTAARIAIYSEYFDGDGLLGLLRRLRGTVLALKYSKRVEAIFAIGEHATKWFALCGFDKNKIHEFGYFVNVPVHHTRGVVQRTVVFAGRISRQKGVYDFVHAASKMPKRWSFQFIGDGPERAGVERLCGQLGCARKVQFVGGVSRSEAIQRIAAAGVLVLPSIAKDGWGVVVNEALLQGTSVVVSNRCGSMCLFGHRELGMVFRAGDVDDLGRCLETVIADRESGLSSKNNVSRKAYNLISPIVGARYLISLSNGEMAPAPWRRIASL